MPVAMEGDGDGVAVVAGGVDAIIISRAERAGAGGAAAGGGGLGSARLLGVAAPDSCIPLNMSEAATTAAGGGYTGEAAAATGVAIRML